MVLTESKVNELCTFIESKLEKNGCDHSLKYTLEWAENNAINKDDLIDILDSHGGHCDCEVVMNLPEGGDLELETTDNPPDNKNPFKIPIHFISTDDKMFDKALFASDEYKRNNYTFNNELIVPAPFGYKSKKRVRKSIHFFNGTTSELPTELGIVKSITPTNATDFAKKVRNSGLKSFSNFSAREANYYLSKIDNVDIGKPMGTYFMEKTGIGGPKIELRIHKVIIKKNR